MNLIKTLTRYALYTLLCLVFVSCKNECKEQDENFRPHKVTHHHKSKTYYYYHNDPCDCYSVDDDINGEGTSHYEPADFVEYYDNGEKVIGRRYPKH